MSYADKIFVKNIKEILKHGVWDTDKAVRPKWKDGEPAHTIKKFCLVNRYDLSKEFPIITLRKTAYKNCIDELLTCNKNLISALKISNIKFFKFM